MILHCDKCGQETEKDYGYTIKTKEGKKIKDVVLCASCCEDFEEVDFK